MKRCCQVVQRRRTLLEKWVGDLNVTELSSGPLGASEATDIHLKHMMPPSNSFKKTQPPVLLTKIDDRLEQYTTAIEYSQEVKAAKQGLMDIPMSPEAVSSKKNLFEAGEAWNQCPTKGTPTKDAESLKVGVADMITQWVKGNPDGTSSSSPSRPADVKAGDVMQKKNMWEIIGETSPGSSGAGAKGNPSGKKYKFVMTAHGKYEKIPVDDENMDGYTNGKAGEMTGSRQ
ncbi:hypothetical protein J4Q44_G00206610 [Coregonus suidteri]|uniref:Uncharacterized protein n=1 Tax=Coregonus suidteri TaxID=861788 RepID=A0AAN8QSB5_9TELE